MRVRVTKDHSSTMGPKRAKHVDEEFTVRAEDAEAFIAAGLLAEAPAKKAKVKD